MVELKFKIFNLNFGRLGDGIYDCGVQQKWHTAFWVDVYKKDFCPGDLYSPTESEQEEWTKSQEQEWEESKDSRAKHRLDHRACQAAMKKIEKRALDPQTLEDFKLLSKWSFAYCSPEGETARPGSYKAGDKLTDLFSRTVGQGKNVDYCIHRIEDGELKVHCPLDPDEQEKTRNLLCNCCLTNYKHYFEVTVLYSIIVV